MGGVLDMVMLLSSSKKVWQSCTCKSVSRLEKLYGMSMMMMNVVFSVPTSPSPRQSPDQLSTAEFSSSVGRMTRRGHMSHTALSE